MSSTLHPRSEHAGQRVTVLGGLGFMGSHVCRELAARGYAVRIFGKPSDSRELIRDFEREVEVVVGDISHQHEVLRAIADADALIHLVHTTVPGSSMEDPEYDITSNVIASVRWLRYLGETNVRRVLYISSGGTVYGVPQTDLIDEGHQTNPINSYGITKLAVEKYVAMYASLFKIDYCLVRR